MLQQKDFDSAIEHLKLADSEFSEAQNKIDKLGGNTLDIFRGIPFLSKISTGKNIVYLGKDLTGAIKELSEISKLMGGVKNPLEINVKLFLYH